MPKKKKNLEGKYIFRRIILVLLLLAAVGAGGWYMGQSGLFSSKQPEEGVSAGVPQDSVAVDDEQLEDSEAPEPGVEEPEPMDTTELGNWNLILVNLDNPLPDDFTVDLTLLYRIDDREFQVDARILDDALAMFNQAKLDGIDIFPTSAYRSVEYQEYLFDRSVQEYMDSGANEEEAIAATASLIAVPASSEHHTGLAIDIISTEYTELDEGFENTPAFRWLDANAHKYGFILRYPKDKTDITQYSYEPWHYRYVGAPHAQIIKENGYCLEEYLELMKTSAQVHDIEQPEGDDEESGVEEDAQIEGE